MLFHADGKTYRFSFKHEVFQGAIYELPVLTHNIVVYRYADDKNNFNDALMQEGHPLRGQTTCFLAELPPLIGGQADAPAPVPLAEGIAHCAAADNYNKDRGRVLALRRALENAFPGDHAKWALAFAAYSNRRPQAKKAA